MISIKSKVHAFTVFGGFYALPGSHTKQVLGAICVEQTVVFLLLLVTHDVIFLADTFFSAEFRER